MSTTLENVGQQVWRGALLMGDYLLSNLSRLTGATILELGAGTGLVSVIAAMSGAHVFCTGEKHRYSNILLYYLPCSGP